MIFIEVLTLLFLAVLVSVIVVLHNSSKEREGGSYVPEPKKPFCYKGKWAWKPALDEYLRMTGKNNADELTEDETRQVYRYAMMPIAYYFYWLLEKGFLSEDFYTKTGNEISEDDIKNSNIDVLGLLEDMDCCLGGGDMLEGAGEFSREYAELKYAALNSNKLLFDYYDTIKNPGGYYYCVDFSWEACRKMCEKTDKAYEEWSALFDHNFVFYEDEEEAAVNQLYSKRFGNNLDIYRTGKRMKDNITDGYIRKCMDNLDSMDEYQFKRFDRIISDVYGDSFAGKVMEQFQAREMHIFEPQNDDDLAYVVSGKANFEEEHGVSFYVKNGIIFSFGYGYDFDDIYSAENIRDYEIAANDIEFENISDETQLAELVAIGKLVRIYLIPAELGGKADEGNIVYLTPFAVKKKELLDSRLQALITAWDGRLKYDYKAVYYDDKKRFVPQRIYVSHNAQPTYCQFGFHISVWM